ncbi:hypothetical protein ABK040_013583 [Willaertia magna]
MKRFISFFSATLCLLLLVILFVTSSISIENKSYAADEQVVISNYFKKRELEKSSLEYVHQHVKLENKRNLNGINSYMLKRGQLLQLDPHVVQKRNQMSFTGNVASYKATTRYNIVNVDFHPLIKDIGCYGSKFYLKVATNQISEVLNSNAIKYDTALVSTLKANACEMKPFRSNDANQKNDLIYRRIISRNPQVIALDKDFSLVLLNIEVVDFTSLFDTLDFYFKTNPQPHVNPSSAEAAYFAEEQTNTESHSAARSNMSYKRGTKWNTYLSLANINYNYFTGQVIEPVIEKREVNSYGEIKITCTNCYFHMGLGLEVTLSLGWFKISHFRASVTGDVNSNFDIHVKATAYYDRTFEILSKRDIGDLNFWISIVPFHLSFGVGLESRVVVNALFEASLKFSLAASHQLGIEYTHDDGMRSLDDYTKRQNDFVFDTSVHANIDITVHAIPTLYLTLWGTIPVKLSIKPYLNANIYSSSSSGCALGYQTYWGLGMGIGVDTIKVWGYTITRGRSWDFSLVGKSALECSICARCLIPYYRKKRELMDESLPLLAQIENVDATTITTTAPTTVLDCCHNKGYDPITLNSTYDVYPYFFYVSEEDVASGLGVVLETTNASMIIEIEGHKYHPATHKHHIMFSEFTTKATNLTVIVSRENQSPENLSTFSMKYYKNNLHHAIPALMKTGTISLGVKDCGKPTAQWLYFSVQCEASSTCYLFHNDEIVNYVNRRLDVSAATYPLKLHFQGKGTITMYSVYRLTSGEQLERLFIHNTTFMIEYRHHDIPFSLESVYLTSSDVQIPGKQMTISATHYLRDFLPEQTILRDNYLFAKDKIELNEKIEVFDPVHYFAITVKGQFDKATVVPLRLEFLSYYYYNLAGPQVVEFKPQYTFILHYMLDQKYWTNYYSDSNSNEMKRAGLFMSIEGRNNTIQISKKHFSKYQKDGVFYEGLKPTNQFALSAYYLEPVLLSGHFYIRIDFPKQDRGIELPLKLIHEPLLHVSTSVSISYLDQSKISYHNNSETNSLTMVGFNETYLQETITLHDIMTNGMVIVISINDPQYTFKEEAFQHPDDILKFFLKIKGSSNSSSWNNDVIPYINNHFQSNETHIAHHFFLLTPQRIAVKFPPLPFYKAIEGDVLTIWGFENYGFLFPEPKDMTATKGLALPHSNGTKIGIKVVVVLLVVLICLLV